MDNYVHSYINIGTLRQLIEGNLGISQSLKNDYTHIKVALPFSKVKILDKQRIQKCHAFSWEENTLGYLRVFVSPHTLMNFKKGKEGTGYTQKSANCYLEIMVPTNRIRVEKANSNSTNVIVRWESISKGTKIKNRNIMYVP
mgnify:CR=1 FL=1